MGGGGFGFNQSKGSSRLDVKHPYRGTPFEALLGPLAELFLGLSGQTDPYAIERGKAQGELVTPNTNPLAGLPQAPQDLLTPAALGGNEQQILDQLMTGGGARRKYLNQTLRGDNAGGPNPLLDKYIRAAQRPTLQGLEETLDRTLPGQFTGAGQMVQPGQSSAFDRAAAIAYRGAADANADIATNIGYNAYNSDQDRRVQAQTAAAQISQQETETMIKNLQAQGLPRLIQQHGKDLGLAEFQRQTESLMQLLSLLSGFGPLQPTTGSRSNSSSLGFNAQGTAGGGE